MQQLPITVAIYFIAIYFISLHVYSYIVIGSYSYIATACNIDFPTAGHDLCCTGNSDCVSSYLPYLVYTFIWKLAIYVPIAIYI